MADYVQIEFPNTLTEKREILIAELNNAGYEGFEEGKDNLKAFIALENFDEGVIKDIACTYNTAYTETIIKETNWNQVWESGFQPVIIDDFCAIRANFHAPVSTVKYDIVITPKMSFGTGHHATSYLMIQQMAKLDFTNKDVFDFGTGTGILAIVAEKMGAGRIIAVDNDDWSIDNAKENFYRNLCEEIELYKTDSVISDNTYDIILANINRNIILENLMILAKQLNPDGVMLLSGLLENDKNEIVTEAGRNKLSLVQSSQKDNWICLLFKK